eukprot:2461599-Rhodomonas_salina.1
MPPGDRDRPPAAALPDAAACAGSEPSMPVTVTVAANWPVMTRMRPSAKSCDLSRDYSRSRVG